MARRSWWLAASFKQSNNTGGQTGEVSPHLLAVPAPVQLWVTAIGLWSDTHPTALAQTSLPSLCLGADDSSRPPCKHLELLQMDELV